MTKTKPVVKFENVSQNFGTRQVLAGVNLTLDFESTPFVVVMGQSGAGKSTLVNMVGGVPPEGERTPTSGVVKLDDQVVTGQHDDVVTVFQGRTNFPHLTVRENVEFPFRLRYWAHPSRVGSKAGVDAILEKVGLTASAGLLPQQLSGGMQQRLQLARAFVVRPRILLMDEPFSALDPKTRAGMHKILIELSEETGTSVIFVTHDVPEALALGHRIIVLGGKPANVIGDMPETTLHVQRSALWVRNHPYADHIHGLIDG